MSNETVIAKLKELENLTLSPHFGTNTLDMAKVLRDLIKLLNEGAAEKTINPHTLAYTELLNEGGEENEC